MVEKWRHGVCNMKQWTGMLSLIRTVRGAENRRMWSQTPISEDAAEEGKAVIKLYIIMHIIVIVLYTRLGIVTSLVDVSYMFVKLFSKMIVLDVFYNIYQITSYVFCIVNLHTIIS